MLLPSQPMLISFPTRSFKPNPPKLIKHFNISPKMLSKVVTYPLFPCRTKILLHYCTTYKWIDNHYVLSIIITLFTLIAIKEAIANVILVASNKTPCIISTIPQPNLSISCF
jgi:hypothetical protein